MIEGARIVVSIVEPATRSSASAFARKKRVRWKLVAPSALKKTNRLDARLLGRAQQPVRAERGHLLDAARRLIANRGGQVDHRVGAADGVAEAARIAEIGERELHANPLRTESARIANQAADLVARVEQPGQQRGAHDAGPSGEQDHPRNPTPAACTPRMSPSQKHHDHEPRGTAAP